MICIIIDLAKEGEDDNMRYMLLSFKASVFNRVISGEKIFEHRRNFPDEEVIAYLYVGKPIQSIVGVMHLNNRVCLSEWKNKYSYDKDACLRIDDYLKHYRYVMQIQKYQHTNMIPLAKLKQDLPSFSIPYMYYYIEGTPLLEYLEKNIVPEVGELVHNFDTINSSQICNS